MEAVNNTGDPYARTFVTEKVKNMNLKVLNLMPSINEIRFLAHHKS